MHWLGDPHWSVSGFVSEEMEIEIQKKNKLAIQLSGYDPMTLLVIETAYGDGIDVTPEQETAYRNQLFKKDQALYLQMNIELQALGASEHELKWLSSGYLGVVTETLDNARNAISDSTAKYLLETKEQIGLLSESQNAESVDLVSIQNTMQVYVNEKYEKRANNVLALANQRQELLEKRLSVLHWEYFPSEQEIQPRVIVMLNTGKDITCMVFKLDNNDSIVSDPEIDTNLIIKTEEEARVYLEKDYSVIVLYLEDLMEFSEQLNEVVQVHFNNLDDE